jgi:hypothetical protein
VYTFQWVYRPLAWHRGTKLGSGKVAQAQAKIVTLLMALIAQEPQVAVQSPNTVAAPDNPQDQAPPEGNPQQPVEEEPHTPDGQHISTPEVPRAPRKPPRSGEARLSANAPVRKLIF